MTVKTFFKKIGRGIQSAVGETTKSFGAGIGSVLGPAAGNALIEAAPALLAFKTGGRIPGKKGKNFLRSGSFNKEESRAEKCAKRF